MLYAEARYIRVVVYKNSYWVNIFQKKAQNPFRQFDILPLVIVVR